jgi:HD superfamily phosphohydrolase
LVDQTLVHDFKTRIEALTEDALSSYVPTEKIDLTSGKYIHDAVWGTNYYEPWELALIDSPLIQRLRNIHQTGLAFLVYPSALHTRFDHTLGVIAIVDKVVDSLNRKTKTSPILSYEERCTLRLAAVLHDVGHGPFSHVVEDVYKETNEFKAIKNWIIDGLHVNPKPHEIMSYLIVSSDYFKAWFDQRIRKDGMMERNLSTVVDVNKIAGYIIGYSADTQKKYLADIINGPMDADKLDYLARDAKFSGLSIGYDLDRYFKTIDIHRMTINDKVFVRLSVPLSGVNSLEQMIISKMMLYSSLYHHQKVRCVERMFVQLCANVMKGESKKAKLKIEHPVDFLKFVDSDFIKFLGDNPFKKEAEKLYFNISKRNLMKRALIISRPFVRGIEESISIRMRFQKLLSDCKSQNEFLRKRIAEEATKIAKKQHKVFSKIEANHILIDIPEIPSMEETIGTTIPIDFTVLGEDRDVEVDEIFPIKAWVEGYTAVKWRGHVFCYKDFQPYVNKAARKVFLEAPYNILFSRSATVLCKIKYCMLEEEKQMELTKVLDD